MRDERKAMCPSALYLHPGIPPNKKPPGAWSAHRAENHRRTIFPTVRFPSHVVGLLLCKPSDAHRAAAGCFPNFRKFIHPDRNFSGSSGDPCEASFSSVFIPKYRMKQIIWTDVRTNCVKTCVLAVRRCLRLQFAPLRCHTTSLQSPDEGDPASLPRLKFSHAF